MSRTKEKRIGVILLMIAVAAATRLVPHPANFTPIGGMALFGAAYLHRRFLAYLVPLAALYLSNLALDNIVYRQYYDGFVWWSGTAVWVLGATALIVLFGSVWLKRVTAGRVLGGAVIAALIFYLVTNFGAWWHNPAYSQDGSGLIASYIAGLPFLRNTILGNVFWSAVLFGIVNFDAVKKVKGQRLKVKG